MEIRAAGDHLVVPERAAVQDGVKDKSPVQEENRSSEHPQDRAYSKAEMDKEIDHLNTILQSKNSHLHFVLHDKLNEYYVQVVDDSSNEVIKEIPSKKIMDMVANFYEKLGIIVDKKI